MQKVIFGIFAHPDDEAFGPSGYFIQQTRAGAELHLVTLTMGEHGINLDDHTNLARVREAEWRHGGELMGATSQHALGFTDGCLCNQDMLKATEKIDALVSEIISGRNDIEIEFVTMDLNGITGHLDHIAAARATALVLARRRQADSRFKNIRLICLSREEFPAANTDWVYMEPGRRNDEINDTVDTRYLRDEIIAVMRAHYTQRNDGEMHIKNRGANLGLYHFRTL